MDFHGVREGGIFAEKGHGRSGISVSERSP
jgi:hypothetical protein